MRVLPNCLKKNLAVGNGSMSSLIHWRGWDRGNVPPPETEKIVVEKWCYL